MTVPTAETPTGVAVPTSDDDFETEPQEGTSTPQEGASSSEPETFDKDYVDKLRKENAKHRTEARAAQKALETARAASMSEQEKAIAEAEKRGQQAASAEYGQRFVRATFDALAARRNPEVDTDPIVEYMDMGKFLDEDGEVDTKQLQAAVDRLVPEAASGSPSQDGGVRAPSKTTDMNQIIRNQARARRSV